jgi:hypothetical protein
MTVSGGPGLGQRTRDAVRSPDSYGLVLALIVATYALAVAQGTSQLLGGLVLLVQITTVWFVLRTARARRGVRAAALAVLVAAGVVAVTGGLIGGKPSEVALLMASTVLYFIAPLVVGRHLIERSVVDRETLLGVIAAYLLIGMFFAFLYRTVGAIEPDPFFGAGGDADPARTLFFSFTTLSTTGYGNLVPAGTGGQTLAVSEMIIGQLFLITALGKVVSVWSPIRRTRDERSSAEEPLERPADEPKAVSTGI